MTRSILLAPGAVTHWLGRLSCIIAFCLAGLSTAGAVDLTDNFNRPDGPDVGNGWIEKQPDAFNLANGEVVKQSVSTGYINNIVYRPASENTLDTEASLEFRLTSTPVGYPQVFVRLQSDVGDPDVATGYILFMSNSPDQALLRRQTGYGFQQLATLYLSSSLNQTDTYRMRLRATGTDPVQLNAYIERDNGGAWDIIGQASFNDGNAARIDTAGAVGFGGYVEASYVYDNFTRLDLDGAAPPDNPVPTAASVAPDSATAGSGDLTITVNGADFLPESVVRWNGADRVTNFISDTQLEADITAADLSAAGNAGITVFNPAPGGGESGTLNFTIDEATGNPLPAITGLNPDSAVEGGSAFSLTVNGSDFVPGAVVRWNGNDRPTTYLSDTQLDAAIPDTDIANDGTATVTVVNPAPGGGVSNSEPFTIDPLIEENPVPTVSGVAPDTVTEGSAGFMLTVTGTDFVPGAVVRWNGSDRSTTFLSQTGLEAIIDAADVAGAGTADVTVVNPMPGGGESNAGQVTIEAAGPSTTQSLNAVSPNNATAGDGDTVITLYGTGFTGSSVARLDGDPLNTIFVSSTQLTATIDASALTDSARPAITVNTPEADNTVSAPVPFYVVEAGDVLFADDFNRPDNANIGNGWTEKLPSAFSLNDGRVSAGDTTPRGFNNVITYRPAAEDAADVEVGMEFIRTDSPDPRFPQVHLRALRDTIDQPDLLTSYTAFLYDENPQRLTVTTIRNFQECYLAQFPLSEPVVVGERYRLRFRALDANPVRLTANLDHFADGRWENIATGTVLHGDDTEPVPGLWCSIGYMPPPSEYDHAGSVGFAKYIYASDEYDNFYSVRLANNDNDVPVAGSLTPASAPVGSGAFPLTVNGSGFMPGSTVRWDGTDLPTTYLSPTQLEADIGADYLASATTADITVFNPAPGGGESGSLPFSVTDTSGDLFDNFNRADDTAIGNGWIEKQGGAFSLGNGQAQKNETSSGYLDNIVYRPAGENVLDVEASAELRFNSAIWGFPQILVRVQSDTVGTYDRLDGYILYVNNNDSTLILGRQRYNSFVIPLATVYLNSPLDTTNAFRLRLRATGTDPVQLTGIVERQTAGGWVNIGQANATDSNSERITTPGSVGFGGYINGTYAYDNFLRQDLSD